MLIADSETIEVWSSTLSNAATIIALAIGGWWTWHLFVKQRTGRVRASVSHGVSARALGDADYLVRAKVIVENKGTVLLPIEELRCELRQVAPPHAETLSLLAQRNLISETENRAKLYCIRCYEPHWKKGEVEIEPEESETFDFDFVVSNEIDSVLLYAFVPNATKKEQPIGWDTSAFHDLLLKSNAEKGP